MLYIDSWVREADKEAQGASIHPQVLAEFSQVFRSAEAADIFTAITGIGIQSKAAVIELFKRVKSNTYNLQAALRDERLKRYTQRTSPFNLD